MELQLFLLVLVVYCRGLTCTSQEYCHGLPCPKFTSKETSIKDVEEHSLNDNEWICTTIKNPTSTDFMEARDRLWKVPDYVASWPVVIFVANGKTMDLCWFVVPGSEPKINVDVRKESRPKVPVYVRNYTSFPTLETGQDEERKLCEDLHEHGITCNDHQNYYVAVYNSYFTAKPFSEIWIEKNP